jgi:branched-chain amino acid transport system permease protein
MQSNTADKVRSALSRRGRWGLGEIAFWLVAAATLFFLPERHLILNEIAIIGLFALSLDLILGYAGIVSLGHAAFFGLGAYAAGILARNGVGDPLVGLGVAAIAAAILGFATSFLVLRGSDLTKLMVTLGVALVLGELTNKMSWLTGGADGLQGISMGPILGLFEFDIFGTVAYTYSLVVTFVLFVLARRIVVSPYGLSLRSIRDNPLRARAVGIPVNRRLVTIGYLYGGLIGAVVFKVLQDVLSAWTPQYWQFWIGLILVLIVLAGRERLTDRIRALWPRSRRSLAADSPQPLQTTTAREV